MNNNKLIAEVNGQRMEFDIYLTFVCPETNKGYIAYTDHSIDEQGREILHYSAYDPNIGFDELKEIQTQEEWDLVNEIIDKIKKIS